MGARELKRSFKELGRTIAEAREAAGLYQEQLAKRAGIGTSSLRQLEKGDFQGPSLVKVARVLRLLDLPVSTLTPIWEATASGPIAPARSP